MDFEKGTNDCEKFINHEKYFKSINNFSLGSNLTEAGEILRILVEEVEKEKTGTKGVSYGE